MWHALLVAVLSHLWLCGSMELSGPPSTHVLEDSSVCTDYGCVVMAGWGDIYSQTWFCSPTCLCMLKAMSTFDLSESSLSPNTDHGCNLKSQLTPSVCLAALLLTFSLLFSILPLLGLVIYVGPYDGFLCPCHLSNLISSPCSLPTHSTELLLCYSTYLVTQGSF